MKIYLPPLMLMGLIFISSSIPMDKNTDVPEFIISLDPTLQNLLHIPVFGLLAFLWLKSFTKHSILISTKVIITLVVTILFGCLDEFHQTFVLGRYGSLIDILLNLVGIFMGILFFLFIAPKRNEISSKSC